MEIVSFTIKNIRDDEGYLGPWARPAQPRSSGTPPLGRRWPPVTATIKSAEARQEGDTAKYKAEKKIAESERDYSVQKAAYETEVNRKRAEAEMAYPLQQEADGDATRSRGMVEAEDIRVQGNAEVDAWERYNQAAIIQQLIDSLLQIAAAIAEPLSQTEWIVVVNIWGDGAAGASRVTKDVTNVIAQMPATVEALTGLDLIKAIQHLPPIKGTEESNSKSEA